jgi:hypothetical protein
MSENPTETKPINPTAASGKGVIKGSFPQYHEGAETPGVKQVLEKAGILSHESSIKLKTPDGTIQGSERSLALRRTRRELLAQFRKTPKTDSERRKTLIAAGHARDVIAEQLVSEQKEVSVEVGDLGRQMARYVVLIPPETSRNKEQDAKPPIFIIPGISADVESVGMLPQELAFSGRKVVLIGFPESWHGEVTDSFGKAAEESKSYEPHTEFFKKAIKTVAGDAAEIDLWGHSTGAAIVAEILTDRQFREQVANAVIIAPPSCVDQKNLKVLGQEIPLPKAIISELWQMFNPKNIRNAAKINVANRRDIQYTKDHRARMLRTYNALREKTLRSNNWWKQDIKVKEGGTITVVSYDQDQMTKSYEVADEIALNPNLHVVKLSGNHTTPLREPRSVIRAISKITNPPVAAVA